MRIKEQTIKHVVAGSTDPSPNSYSKWENINWKRTEKHVRRLQERIYRSAKGQQWKTVRNLQRLLARSYYNKLNAIREVTERNKGKNTPGVDKKTYTTTEEKWNLSTESFDYRTKNPKPVKRTYIPKPDGSKRPLGIPTVIDRIMQAIIKAALEPEWESRFEPNSYGFRPGRSTMDAILQIRSKIGWPNGNQWILDGDISKCFDNISHDSLLQRIPTFKVIIKKWLKAGVVEFGNFYETNTGVPQGGIISPLLANIALDGMEKLFSNSRRVNVVRYADDFVIMADSREYLENIVSPKLTRFLSQQGLNINSAKTSIVHRTEGFNFLGFNLKFFQKKKGSVFLISPQKTKISRIRKVIKSVFRETLHKPIDVVIKRLNTIVRGWTNYYRYSNAKKGFYNLSNRIFHIIWRGLKRLHPTKSAKWIINKYYKQKGNRKWILTSGNISLLDPADILIRRYVQVNKYSSIYDTSQKTYWKLRSKKFAF